MTAAEDRVLREDVLMFVNACYSCSGQREFYADGYGQSVSIEFLHQYILGNYRMLYARTLACAVNDFNQCLIVFNLLSSGKQTPKQDRPEENALISAALAALPPQRAMHLFEQLAKRRVNNRRTRATIRAYLTQRSERRDFQAVKYRRCFRRAALHSHLPLAGELGPFLLRGWKERVYLTPLFETFRQAHFSVQAMYQLPYSIAEGLAAKHGVKRELFLKGIEPRLTENEKLRLQSASRETLGSAYTIDPTRLSPTRLASYVLSRRERLAERATLHAALEASARRAVHKSRARLGKVACVLDRSYSSSGSSEKRRRPLAVALATSYYLRAAAAEYTAFWTEPTPDEVLVEPRGATDLATPILDALELAPDLLVIISDGFDNDPPGVTGQVLKIAIERLGAPFVVHLNPVFDAESYAPKSLCPLVPTLGIRDAEDIPTLLLFARFASANVQVQALLEHLSSRVQRFLGNPSQAAVP